MLKMVQSSLDDGNLFSLNEYNVAVVKDIHHDGVRYRQPVAWKEEMSFVIVIAEMPGMSGADPAIVIEIDQFPTTVSNHCLDFVSYGLEVGYWRRRNCAWCKVSSLPKE